jgi:hypothetical protein
MGDRWLGVSVSGDKAVVVDIEVDADAPYTVHADFTVRLSKGNRPTGYRAVHQQMSDYARENGISYAVVKGSAVSQQTRPSLALLHSAELRGVVIAALSEICETSTITKANISKTYGERKVDEYVADEDFWEGKLEGSELRAGSKEAAFCVIAKAER